MSKRRLPNNARFRLHILSPFCGICEQYVSPLEVLNNRRITVDHIIPINHGGQNKLENLQLAHKKCNGAKGSLPQGHPAIKLRLEGKI